MNETTWNRIKDLSNDELIRGGILAKTLEGELEWKSEDAFDYSCVYEDTQLWLRDVRDEDGMFLEITLQLSQVDKPEYCEPHEINNGECPVLDDLLQAVMTHALHDHENPEMVRHFLYGFFTSECGEPVSAYGMCQNVLRDTELRMEFADKIRSELQNL